MTLTNPLTYAIEGGQAILLALIVGVAALRTLGYTPTHLAMTLSLGAVGLLLGRWAFPRGPLDLTFWSFPFELPPLPGYLWAVGILLLYRAFELYQQAQESRDDAKGMP